ncbi:MAG: glutamine amidotransferase [Planctomycetales bacterium]
MARIYYAGDWALQIGPSYAESPFYHSVKGAEVINGGTWLKEAIESTGEHEVTSVPSWEFYMLKPGEYEKILATYDAVIFSDLEARNFQLSPSFFQREKMGQVLTFPDRIRLTIEAVQGGVGVLFVGGWQSFTGDRGIGGWGRCRLKELLPVTCLDYEDLIENSEGYGAEVLDPGHPILEGMDFSRIPPILGYNQVKPREGFEVVAQWSHTKDPLLAVGKVGKGRTAAFMSDPAPHWGCNFVFWEHYNRFWLNVIEWVVRKR